MSKKIRNLIISLAFVSLPGVCFGAVPVAKQKTITGTVIQAYENQLVFKTTSAEVYRAQTWQAKLFRRYGAAMEFKEILVGDKVEVKGLVWPDNSINAQQIRNISLYAHSGTFSGKVETINSYAKTFNMQSSSQGLLTIRTDQFTIIKKNGANSGLLELEPGYNVSVKGVWERDRANVFAKQILATARLVSIEVSGTLGMVSPTGVSVISSGNVIYGVDTTAAKLQSKNSKTLSRGELMPGHTVKITGKHISGRNQIFASLVKDMSITK